MPRIFKIISICRDRIKTITPFVVGITLVVALFLHFRDHHDLMNTLLGVVLVVFSIPLWIEILVNLYRKNFGVDLIAGLALAASFVFEQYVPGVIVLLMLSGGEALESYAMHRARKSLSEILRLLPDTAHIKTETGIVDRESYSIEIGTIIIVKPGEVIPIDGIVESGASFVDESLMTGESIPVEKKKGSLVIAGTVNADATLEIKVTKQLSDSRIQKIIAMVKQAEENKAPFIRLADRYSVYFTIITIVIAGLAWFVSGDPIRVLSVLVVATPCPLILATPIAFMSGMSALSRKGIIVKNGGALEALARVRAFVFDKTGTITLGSPNIQKIHSYSDLSEKDILMIASSLDQLSVHVLARALVKHAVTVEKSNLVYPDNFKESFGNGVAGDINGIRYFFGTLSFMESSGVSISDDIKKQHDHANEEGVIAVYLASTGRLLGSILFQDEIRPEVGTLFSNLKENGINRLVLLSGDKQKVAERVALSVGIKEFKAEYLPDQKLDFIKEIQTKNQSVAMVGDGVNDAPALMQSNVGIALGYNSATAASDSADIVIISGTIGLVYDAYRIAKRSFSVAKEGIFIGIGLSSVAMIIALLGYLPPFWGALIQEGIDIAVILYALRAGIGFKKD